MQPALSSDTTTIGQFDLTTYHFTKTKSPPEPGSGGRHFMLLIQYMTYAAAGPFAGLQQQQHVLKMYFIGLMGPKVNTLFQISKLIPTD